MWARACGGLCLAAVAICGCGLLPNERGWGEDATLTPGWKRLGDSLVDAAIDPLTWVPIGAAGLLQIGDLDTQLSDWAVEHTPVFGSTDNAETAGSYILVAADVAWIGTALATPSGDQAVQWIPAKLKGLAVDASAQFVTLEVTSALKDYAGRERPGGGNDRSFPSSHASALGTKMTLASRQLDYLPLDATERTVARAGFGTLTALGAWSRLEAQAHYPSDVLVGLALGHFLGAFIQDAFLGLDAKARFDLEVIPDEGAVAVQLGFGF